jgi:hypothetical protein
MSPELQAAVENAYSVFSRYRPGMPLIICTCSVCVSEETERLLRTTPLRNLSVALAFEYSNSCHDRRLLVAQDEQRYFLPRYLDLIAHGEGVELHPDGTAMALSRLRDLDWRTTWPANEVEALETFFQCLMTDWLGCTDVVLRYSYSRHGRDNGTWHLAKNVDDILVLIEESGGDSRGVLNAWDVYGDPPAAIHMAYVCREYFGSSHFNTDFFTKPEVLARIEAAFFEVEDARLQQILSAGAEVLKSYKKIGG